MKAEYDFANGERGKFYRGAVAMRLPIYLDDDVQRYLSERSSSEGIQLGEMVNRLLKREIEVIESGT